MVAMNGKKRLSVEVSPEQHAQIKAEADRHGVTIAAFLEWRLFGGELVNRVQGPRNRQPVRHIDQEALPLSHARSA